MLAGDWPRRAYGRLPDPVRQRVRGRVDQLPAPVRTRLLEPPAPRRARWGNLRRTRPFDRDWGYGRGTPIDRVYIEGFLQHHAADIRGACLEGLNADYTRRFGGGRVDNSDVVDVDPHNRAATVVADLGDPDSLPPARFDCYVFTQTLHLVPDMGVALANAWRALRPGGVLLVTVPGVGRHISRRGLGHDRWRLMPSGLDWLLGRLPDAEFTTTAYGNVLSCIAYLHGLAAEELRPGELWAHDPDFPMIVASRVRKAGS